MSRASLNANLDNWLRTDHGNTMQHVIEFAGSPSDQLTLDAVDDGSSIGAWGGAGMRQIVNVARLYNVGDGDDGLILGNLIGNGV